MHRKVLLLMITALLTAVPAQGAIEQVTSHTLGLPVCTIVVVQTSSDVDSATAKAGEFFQFQTVNAVTHGRHIVIPMHTPGWGVISVAGAAGAHGQAGTLLLDPRFLKLPGGRKLSVVLDHNGSALQKNGNSGNAPGYLGAIPVPGVGAAILDGGDHEAGLFDGKRADDCPWVVGIDSCSGTAPAQLAELKTLMAATHRPQHLPDRSALFFVESAAVLAEAPC